jgi:hypothetical protein
MVISESFWHIFSTKIQKNVGFVLVGQTTFSLLAKFRQKMKLKNKDLAFKSFLRFPIIKCVEIKKSSNASV